MLFQKQRGMREGKYERGKNTIHTSNGFSCNTDSAYPKLWYARIFTNRVH